jgi:hypothetical protein
MSSQEISSCFCSESDCFSEDKWLDNVFEIATLMLSDANHSVDVYFRIFFLSLPALNFVKKPTSSIQTVPK